MRILVIEDENSIAQFIQEGLKEIGYAVDLVQDGQLGLDYALVNEYDLIILDLMLPNMNGLVVLRELRSQNITTPVLILTARDTIDDRVRGLDMGADDYLIKPFAFKELLARIRALLRRPPLPSAQTMLQVDDLEMDIPQRKVRRGDKAIKLTAREFSLLEYLMRHPNQVLTRTQIGEHVWNIDFYNESNTVDVYIGYLRRKIDRGFEQKLIHTVRGVGYQLGTDV